MLQSKYRRSCRPLCSIGANPEQSVPGQLRTLGHVHKRHICEHLRNCPGWLTESAHPANARAITLLMAALYSVSPLDGRGP